MIVQPAADLTSICRSRGGRSSNQNAAPLVHHDAELALVPYTGRNLNGITTIQFYHALYIIKYIHIFRLMFFTAVPIQIVNHLSDTDKPARLAFCREFSEVLHADPNMLNKLMSDEAHFHLSGFVNKQNFRYWSENQLMKVHKQSLRSEKVTVWCDVSASVIIGPYFFEERDCQYKSVQYDYLLLTVADNVRLGQASQLSYAKECSGLVNRLHSERSDVTRMVEWCVCSSVKLYCISLLTARSYLYSGTLPLTPMLPLFRASPSCQD
ncbi:hypothetical protein ANN_15257 [Periplaneta americana]|uniref:Uncharacterized protein n=1 Tax=Periplaneta americana TaxID=6978 RepID=A0ABQ8SFW2_PERAM|nr:hypothetical protein ANN_15257 [Periplaneta americana]